MRAIGASSAPGVAQVAYQQPPGALRLVGDGLRRSAAGARLRDVGRPRLRRAPHAQADHHPAGHVAEAAGARRDRGEHRVRRAEAGGGRHRGQHRRSDVGSGHAATPGPNASMRKLSCARSSSVVAAHMPRPPAPTFAECRYASRRSWPDVIWARGGTRRHGADFLTTTVKSRRGSRSDLLTFVSGGCFATTSPGRNSISSR